MHSAKRRKLDIEAQEKAAELALERIAARDLLLEQLEQEEILVKNSTHPLIDHTHNRLLEEKAIRLAQLAAFRHQHELEIDRRLEADTEATWKRWAVSEILSFNSVEILLKPLHIRRMQEILYVLIFI